MPWWAYLVAFALAVWCVVKVGSGEPKPPEAKR